MGFDFYLIDAPFMHVIHFETSVNVLRIVEIWVCRSEVDQSEILSLIFFGFISTWDA